jgi:hypothetical protein
MHADQASQICLVFFRLNWMPDYYADDLASWTEKLQFSRNAAVVRAGVLSVENILTLLGEIL